MERQRLLPQLGDRLVLEREQPDLGDLLDLGLDLVNAQRRLVPISHRGSNWG
jgi:hypothetical protein